MDQQANDCPCKRLRVSEGDDTDQETGMVLHAAVGYEEYTDKNESNFHRRDASVRVDEQFALQRDESPLDNTCTGASGDSGDSGNASELSKSTYLPEKDKVPELLSIPRCSGDGNRSATGTYSEVNKSTEIPDWDHLNENESENTEACPKLKSENMEADIICCKSKLHPAVGTELKGRPGVGICEYVQNVQAMAESSYIRTRERNASQNESGRLSSLESPKLKRTLDRINTNIMKQRMEGLSNSQSKSDLSFKSNSELKNLGLYAEHPGQIKQGHLGTVMSEDLAKSYRNKSSIPAESVSCSELLVNIQTAHKNEGCEEKDISEQDEIVLKELGQNYSLSDVSMKISNVDTKSNGWQNQSTSNTRYVKESLDDSGFIEMFSNSVMGNIMYGNAGSKRNSGKLLNNNSQRGACGYYGKSVENSNITSNKNIIGNISGEISLNESSVKKDGSKASAAGRKTGDSNETCKFTDLGSLLEDIGQHRENSKTFTDLPIVQGKMSTDALSFRLGTSESVCSLTQSRNATVNESTKEVTSTEQRAKSSRRSNCETPGFSRSCESVTITQKGVKEDRPKNELKDLDLHHSCPKVLDGITQEDLDIKYERVSSLINCRFKLDFEQTQEIISQNNINSLPITVLVQILKNLTVYELLRRTSLVCKYWYNISRDPDIWRNICLVNQHRLTDLDLKRLLSFSDYRVRNVNLTDCRFLTNEGIKYLVLKCLQIEVLRVMRCFDLTDVAFKGVYSLCLCRNLRALYMDGCCRVTDSTVQEVSEACLQLRTLHLNQCTRVSDSGIIKVARKCPYLTDLQLDHCSQVTDEGLSEIVVGCPNLVNLNLMCCGVTDTGVKYLAKLLKLTNLDLSNIPRLTSDSVVYLSKFCKNLLCINVSLNTVMDDHCIAQLAMNLPVLKRLYCVSCSISDKGLEDIAKYHPSLEALDVGWCQEVTDHGVRVISHACKHLDYFGLIRCDRVTIETIEELVLKYPKINYSTFVLESRRLLERARNEGYQFNLPSQ